jgi:hypothetical protein
LELKRFYDKKFILILKNEFLSLQTKLNFSKILFLEEKIKLGHDVYDVIELLNKLLTIENYRKDFRVLFMETINEKYFKEQEIDEEEDFEKPKFNGKWIPFK